MLCVSQAWRALKGVRGVGGWRDVNVEKDPLGLSGLEMTWCEGRATTSSNQSSPLQGGEVGWKDKACVGPPPGAQRYPPWEI